MATTITVFYDNTADATFDMAYYLNTHMPLVAEKFGPHGMTGWRVLKVMGTPDGGAARYSVIALLEFETPRQFEDAVAAEGGPVFGDVPNFSNKGPSVMIGDVVGAGS